MRVGTTKTSHHDRHQDSSLGASLISDAQPYQYRRVFFPGPTPGVLTNFRLMKIYREEFTYVDFSNLRNNRQIFSEYDMMEKRLEVF